MNLSAHFTLAELTVSEVAARNGLDNTPNDEVKASLRWLCEAVLEPLRYLVGRPIVVTSGYRSAIVNHWVNGSKHSDHMLGKAADIICPGLSQQDLVAAMAGSALPFDQLIDEFGAWVHVSFHPGKQPRRQMLRAIKKQKAGVEYVAL